MPKRRDDGDDPTIAGRIKMLNGAQVPMLAPVQTPVRRDAFDEDMLVPIERIDFSQRPIDLDVVRRLAALQLDDEEFMEVLQVDAATLEKVYRPYIENGRAQGLVALRRMQWRKAMQGNVPMLIHLGNQHLGQSEKRTTVTKHEGSIAITEPDKQTPAEQLLSMLTQAAARIKSGQMTMLPQPVLTTPEDEI